MKIWRCPNCSTGCRAPARLDRMDARRWCLVCSAKTGRLVEKSVPSRAAEKVREVIARRATAEKRQERRAVAEAAFDAKQIELATTPSHHPTAGAAWLRAWTPRIVKLAVWRRAAREYRDSARWSPDVTIRQSNCDRQDVPRASLSAWHAMHYGSYDSGEGDKVQVYKGRQRASGRAWPWSHRLIMTVGTDSADNLSTLIHELAHLAAPNREMHGAIFQLIQLEAVEELTGEKIEGWRRGGEEGRVAVIQRWLDKQKVAS